jgi:putative oxidoreductase
MDKIRPWGLLAARILLAQIFLISGFHKVIGFAATAGYMASKGVPMAEFLAACSIVVELAAALMLVAGWKARWAALALALWLIPVTLIFHAFWAAPEAQVRLQTIQFEKNLCILGGLLYVAFTGPGRLSLDKAQGEDR